MIIWHNYYDKQTKQNKTKPRGTTLEEGKR